jgi:endonuclease YncB( thermonuclease family)
MKKRAVSLMIPVAVLAALLLVAESRLGGPAGYKPVYRGAKYIDKSRIEFDDGDTFMYRGKPLRILGVDCPETASPSVGIEEDQPFGRAAAESTKSWIERARIVEYVPDGDDYYGRKLVHVFVDGELLSVKLIEAGLAYETVSHFGDNGFPDLAARILEAAAHSPKPRFMPPYKWRRKHQKRHHGRKH